MFFLFVKDVSEKMPLRVESFLIPNRKKHSLFFQLFLMVTKVNKAEHAVQTYTAGKGNITTLSNTEQTRAMLSYTDAKPY